MTLADIYDLYGGSNLRKRTIVAVGAAAFGILTEDSGTTNHALRLKWAKSVLSNISSEAEKFLWGVIGSPSVLQLGEAVDDGSLSYIVGQLVDTFVGA